MSTPTQPQGAPEAPDASPARGWKGIAKLCSDYAGRLAHVIQEKTRDAAQNISTSLQKSAKKNIDTASANVAKTQKDIEYLTRVKNHIRKIVVTQLSLIRIEHTKTLEDVRKTEEEMQKIRGAMEKTGRWSLPGKRNKMIQSYQKLSQILQKQQAHARTLRGKFTHLKDSLQNIDTIDSTIKRESSFLDTLQTSLNDTQYTTTFTALKTLATSFGNKHHQMLTISTLEIGQLGVQLMDIYHTVIQSPLPIYS